MTYHGITTSDAVRYIAASSGGESVPTPATIRSWVHRGHVERTRDGHIDPYTLEQRVSGETTQRRATLSPTLRAPKR